MKIMIEFLQNSIGICFVIEFAYCVREIVEFVLFLWFLLSFNTYSFPSPTQKTFACVSLKIFAKIQIPFQFRAISVVLL